MKVTGIKYEEIEQLVYVLSDTDTDYQKDAFVVVKQPKGLHLAQVVHPNLDLDSKKLPQKMDHIIRLAKVEDIQKYQENIELAEKRFDAVNQLIQKNQLDMKVLNIVFPLDKEQVLITFTAEQRVDFRQLLKDLAHLFKMRIELRQISSREESKIYGGLGPCGRALCCSTFLGEFPPVSIKMAKDQHLSLNTGKTVGVCGRLMCCLSFEEKFYLESKEKFPDFGSRVSTKDGEGTVTGIDVFAGTLTVDLQEDHHQLTYALEEVTVHG